MDNKITIRELLETYDSIIVNQVYTEDIVMFKLFEKDFLIIGPSKKDLSSKAQIYLYNDEGTDYPHVVLKDIDINKEVCYQLVNTEEFVYMSMKALFNHYFHMKKRL